MVVRIRELSEYMTEKDYTLKDRKACSPVSQRGGSGI